MNGLRFRSVLLLGASALLATAVAGSVLAVSLIVEREVVAREHEQLARSLLVLKEVQRERQAQTAAETRVLAEEPRLKAVVATKEVTRDTISGVVMELGHALGAHLMLLTDASGILIFDTQDPEAEGFDLSSTPIVKAAIATGSGGGIWTDEKAAYSVSSRRLTFGATPVGVLVIGRRIEQDFADAIHDQTGSAVSITLDGKQLALAGAEVLHHQTISSELKFPGYEGEAQLRASLFRSMDIALEPVHRLRWALLIVGALILALSAIGLRPLAARLTHPLEHLVDATREIVAGRSVTTLKKTSLRELDALSSAMVQMSGELERGREAAVAQERLQKELEIAAHIQTSILPRAPLAPHYSIAGRMVPAAQAGGDYYDVLPVPGGCWIGIGDVSGHGLNSGLVMLMTQSAAAAAVAQRPDLAPKELIGLVNQVLFENIRNRIGADDHVTCSFLHCDDRGRVRFAGAHEELIIFRKATGGCERRETSGTWLGATKDLSRFTKDEELQLSEGDVLLLYTDGAIEARDQSNDELGIERLIDLFTARVSLPVSEIVAEMFAEIGRWSPQLSDDVTLLVVRYDG